jgi:hypothetical protein
MNMQQPWSYETFVASYNRFGTERGGWQWDENIPKEELERRYIHSPETYPTIEAFAEGLFIWEQRVNI